MSASLTTFCVRGVDIDLWIAVCLDALFIERDYIVYVFRPIKCLLLLT